MSDSGLDIGALAGEGMHEHLISEAQRLLKQHGLQSVRIFATWQDDDSRTFGASGAAGNYYANFGQTRLFVESELEKERASARGE